LIERIKRELREDLSQPDMTPSGRGHNRGPPFESEPPVYIAVKDAAKILNVSPSYLNKLRMTGSGPVFAKFGAHVRYAVPALMAWAETRARTSTSDSGQGV
jgi:hypothetical protein